MKKDISDIIAKAIATTLNDQEKQKEGKVDSKTDFLTWSVVKDTPHLTNCFSVLENCTVGSTKDMLDSNALPVTEEVVSKSETPKPADTQSEREK